MLRIKKPTSVFLLFILSLIEPASGFSQEQPIRYIFSIDGKASGKPFYAPMGMYLDQKAQEIYILDLGNRRIAVTDTKGVFLYEFSYADAGISEIVKDLAVDKDGYIYIPQVNKINMLSYRGIYRGDVDMSAVPNKDNITIQSLAFDGAGRLYIGDGTGHRVAVLDRDKKFLFEFGKKDNVNTFMNAGKIGIGNDDVYVLDAPAFSIFRFDKQGGFISRLGIVSSLPGGFAMPIDIAVEAGSGRVVVLDMVRLMVIVFSREGGFLFEFGGPQTFKQPKAVGVDGKGRIYVLDMNDKIRVFQVIEEAAPVGTKPEPPAPAPVVPAPAAPEPAPNG